MIDCLHLGNPTGQTANIRVRTKTGVAWHALAICRCDALGCFCLPEYVCNRLAVSERYQGPTPEARRCWGCELRTPKASCEDYEAGDR